MFTQRPTYLLAIIFMISSSVSSASILNTAKLTPLQTFDNGARVMQSTLAVQNIGTTTWGVTTWGQQGWHFIISIPNTFGFDSTQKSSISLTINGPFKAIDTDDLIFGFTTNNQEYVSMSVPMDNRGRGTKIYPPACNTLGHGDIAGLPVTNRECDVSGGDCANWQSMNAITTPQLPLTITLINNPIIGDSALFVSTLSSTVELNEYCKYASFSTMDGLKIYIAAKSPGSSLLIDSFDISAEVFPPTAQPSSSPTSDPTPSPTTNPTKFPSNNPTISPTAKPTLLPTRAPTKNPTHFPTKFPSNTPTKKPTNNPTSTPTKSPTNIPTSTPTKSPSKSPSNNPTPRPTNDPTLSPSKHPTQSPSKHPTLSPTPKPTKHPTQSPSRFPTIDPTEFPTTIPTEYPTKSPIIQPTMFPSKHPTKSPNTQHPTLSPTNYPTSKPSMQPTQSTLNPTSKFPTNSPSTNPTKYPTKMPTVNPTTKMPTKYPSFAPTQSPTHIPTAFPTQTPTPKPSNMPSHNPIIAPTATPTTHIPTESPVPFGYEWGAFGQLCASSNVATKCDIGTMDTISDILGVTQCTLPWDCCKCTNIKCGILNTKACDSFRVIGNFGAFGVQNIQIYGDANQVANGAVIECHGIESCRQTFISGQYIEGIVCDAARSCMDAHFIINEPKSNFLVECAGVDACNGLKIEINLKALSTGYRCANTLDILPFSKISCIAPGACHGLELILNNGGCKNIVFDRLDCQEQNACQDAKFEFIGAVDFKECLCGPSCQSASGLSKCFQNLAKIVCGDSRQCFGQIQTVLNPMNGFLFECSDVESCAKSNFEILIDGNSNQMEVVTVFDGFKFGGTNAALSATFVINNEQSGWITVESIECSGTFSCVDTTFITGTNVIIEDISCATNACKGCIIKQKNTDLGVPCQSQQIGGPI